VCNKLKNRKIKLVNNGVSLELIGAMMGHVNTATTRKYAHLNKITALREAFER
jgi:site-specific recombinase XerD